MWREHNIINCFTIEASFQSYLNSIRENVDFTPSSYEKMGQIIGRALYEYVMIKDEDEKFKEKKLFAQLNKRKKKIKFQQKLKTLKKKNEILIESSDFDSSNSA